MRFKIVLLYQKRFKIIKIINRNLKRKEKKQNYKNANSYALFV
jgi:hypothetical protein